MKDLPKVTEQRGDRTRTGTKAASAQSPYTWLPLPTCLPIVINLDLT